MISLFLPQSKSLELQIPIAHNFFVINIILLNIVLPFQAAALLVKFKYNFKSLLDHRPCLHFSVKILTFPLLVPKEVLA